MKNLIITIIFSVFFILSNFHINNVRAQTGINLKITPPLSYIQVKPGSRDIHTITLENIGEQKLQITPLIRDFTTNLETGAPILSDNYSFEYFVSLDEQLKTIILEPDKKAQINLVIAPPQTAEEKEYPLSIVFESRGASNLVDSSNYLSGSIASNLIILISDKNELSKKQSIKDLGVPQIIESFQPIVIKPILKNETFATSTASGSAVIKNMLGKEVARFNFYPDNILGYSQRPIRAIDNSQSVIPQPIPMIYDPGFLIGPYSLTITLNNNNEQNIFNTTVFAVPIFIFIIISLGILLITWYKKQISKKNPFK